MNNQDALEKGFSPKIVGNQLKLTKIGKLKSPQKKVYIIMTLKEGQNKWLEQLPWAKQTGR